jgi:hypothetical protein
MTHVLTLLVLTVGEFGRRVGEELARTAPRSVVLDTTDGSHPGRWPGRDVLVVAADGDPEPLTEAVERAAFAWRRPWFPIVVDHPYLRCGPVVVPGAGACGRCFRRRRAQHGALPGPDVRGFAQHHVGIAVALGLRALAEVREARATPVYSVGMHGGPVGQARVVAVDQCERCRPQREPEARQDKLVAALTEVCSA